MRHFVTTIWFSSLLFSILVFVKLLQISRGGRLKSHLKCNFLNYDWYNTWIFYHVIVCWFILICMENILYSIPLALPYINLDGVLQIVLDGAICMTSLPVQKLEP